MTYTDSALIPRLLAHAITLTSPEGGAPSTGLSNPVPVGCKALAVLSPPLAGDGWFASHGCCTIAAYHRYPATPFNGALGTFNHFAIDYVQLGPNNACCKDLSRVTDLTSWWGYNAPVLAAATGVVIEVADGIPDNQPLGIPTNVTIATAEGNHVVEDIGGGRYIS